MGGGVGDAPQWAGQGEVENFRLVLLHVKVSSISIILSISDMAEEVIQNSYHRCICFCPSHSVSPKETYTPSTLLLLGTAFQVQGGGHEGGQLLSVVLSQLFCPALSSFI